MENRNRLSRKNTNRTKTQVSVEYRGSLRLRPSSSDSARLSWTHVVPSTKALATHFPGRMFFFGVAWTPKGPFFGSKAEKWFFGGPGSLRAPVELRLTSTQFDSFRVQLPAEFRQSVGLLQTLRREKPPAGRWSMSFLGAQMGSPSLATFFLVPSHLKPTRIGHNLMQKWMENNVSTRLVMG